MIHQVRIPVKNAVVLLMDRNEGEIPEFLDDRIIASTATCIAVGTMAEIDGETLLVLSDEDAPVKSDPGLKLIFEGELRLPRKELSLCTVLLESLLTISVVDTQSTVKIWANDDKEPDKIWVTAKS